MEYVYVLGKHFARVDGDLDNSTVKKYFYHTDHLGSTVAVTDEAGQMVWVSEYTPFGGKHSTEGELTHAAKFTGKDLDEDIGLYYFNARWYDQEIGRFVSEDPLPSKLKTQGIEEVNGQLLTFEKYIEYNGLGWYLYVNNNPVTLTDPKGLATWVNKDGYVKNVTEDDDLNIYQWDGFGSYVLDEAPSSLDIHDTENNSWNKIGETRYWDAFISPDTSKAVGKVVVGESIDKYIWDLVEKAGDYGKNKTFYESKPKGEFDIKTQYPGHEGYSYHGFLFEGKYMTLREAGNMLAGMNAAQFDMVFSDFQKGSGALEKGGTFGVFLYNSLGKTYGEPPMYGEKEYQYTRSLYGYSLYKERFPEKKNMKDN